MGQLNLNLTPDFERALARFMRLRSISRKSEAVRVAVQEAAEREGRARRRTDFAKWRGAALGPTLNENPRFRTEDELWE
jgi:hypothetical protein